MFNSQAVPEPEVFNAKGFSVNTFVSDSRAKRSSDSAAEHTSPRSFKKSRPAPNETTTAVAAGSIKKESFKPPVNAQTPPPSAHQTTQPPASANPISNLYNAYTMARMFPFMYQQQHPQQHPMQYAAHLQQQQSSIAPNHSSPTASSFFSMLNQNLLQYNMHQSRSYSAYTPLEHQQQQAQHQHQQNSVFSTLFTNHSSNNSTASSDDHPANSSANLSYSNSSRSSSLSPMANKVNGNDHQHQLGSKADLGLQESASKSSTKKSSFNIEQMLSTKTTRDMQTQTEPSCLSCPVCSNKCI